MLCYMMVGLPATGKTIFRRHVTKFHARKGWTIISVDDIIEREAIRLGKPYEEVYQSTVKMAQDRCLNLMKRAVSMRTPIIIDQTNLTKEDRKMWLDMIPANYKRIAVVCEQPKEAVWRQRITKVNKNPKGKRINVSNLDMMLEQFEYPTKDEGFEEVRNWR